MSGRLRFEAWTLPTAGTFEKITDIPALAGSTGTRELSAYTDGSLTVAADWDGLDLIISDTVGSLIRVYDGTTLVDEFLAERLDVPVDRPSAVTISGTQINGIVEKLAVYPYNYPNDIATSQDWVWGGPTILPSLTLADLANVREVWELWHDGTGGSYTLTVDGQTTASIDYTIVSPLVIENRLQSLSTVTDVTVSGSGSSVREVIELYNNATGGSQGLTVTYGGTSETATWAYNAAAGTVDTALQTLTFITATTVTGAGTLGSPWVITFDNPNNPSSVAKSDTLLTGGTSTLTPITSGEDTPFVITFHNPPNPGTVTITDSLTGGTATLTQITAGTLDPSPITQSQRADARIDPDLHGTYGSPPIEVVETNLNTGSDWALLVNATGQFAGSQIILTVKPGHTYSDISVPVRPDSNGSYRLVIRDIYENLVAGPDVWETSLTAGSYQTLTVPQFTVPNGVYQIVMRVAVVGATYADFRVDWQHATINEGDEEATPGEIVRILIENAQTERTAFTFLDIAGFSDTVDTAATSWGSSISFTASFGQHMGHVLDGLASLGYEWQITPKGTPTGGFTHDLDLFMPDGAGTDLTATTGGPAVMSNTVAAANVVKRIPAYTAGLAWGNETYLEDTDPTRLTNFGRFERVFDVEHLSSTASLQELLDEQFAEQATNLTATQATIRDDTTTPLVDYEVGDTIWWQFPGTLAKEARRIKRVSWAHDDLATYTLHASTVHTGDSAMAAAVNRLLNKYERRRNGRSDDQPFLTPATVGAGSAYDLVVAAVDSVDPYRADVVCTGANDDATIEAAIAAYSGPNGCSVFLLGGNYRFDAACNVGGRNTSITGSGNATVINSYSADYAFFANDGYTKTFRNLKLKDQGSTVYGITSSGTSTTADYYIEGCWIEGFTYGAHQARTAGNMYVDHCYFTLNTHGVYCAIENYTSVNGSLFESNVTAGVSLPSQRSQISGNRFTGGVYGIYYDAITGGGGPGHTAVTGNTFLSQTTSSISAADTHGGGQISIVGNVFGSSPLGFDGAVWFGATNVVAIVGNVFGAMTNAYDTTDVNAASVFIGNVFTGGTPTIDEAAAAGLLTTSAVFDDITDVDTTTTAPVNGDLLVFDGTNWVPQTTPFFGQIYLTTPTATTIASSGVFYKMLGTTTLVSGGNAFDMPANNRLRYTGTPTRRFMISVTGSSTTQNSSVTVRYRIAKNGTTAVETEVNWLHGASTDQRTFPINHIVELATNDYVELFVANITGTGSVTLQRMNMIANGIL